MSVAISRKMKGTIKSFDDDNHAKNDVRGRIAVKKFLDENTSLHTIDNPNRYGIDLLSLNKNDEVIACWEIEVREEGWPNDTSFPHRTVNCIERKEYQWRKEPEFLRKIPFDLTKNCEIFYVQVNNLCTRCIVVDSSIILNYRLIPWSNKKAKGEYVRQVPVGLCKQYKI